MSEKSLRLTIVVLLMSVLAAAQATSARTFKVIDLNGSSYHRGLQHGRVLKAEIHKAVEVWKENLRAIYGIDPDAFIKKFASGTNYTAAIEKWTPDLLKEVHGIADGAKIDFTTMLVYQLVDEYWVNGTTIVELDHCSALGVSATDAYPAIVAQNLDLEGFRDGTQTILHITEPSGLQQFVLTAPGLIGMNGMNSKGVAVATNTLTQLANARAGLPVAFVVRGVLERATFKDARDFVKTVRHASGQNYTIGGNGEVAYFEASSSKVVQFDPPQNGTFIYHTNHPLVNDDYSREGVAEAKTPNPRADSRLRYAALDKRLAPPPAGDIIEIIQQTLRSRDSEYHPVSRRYIDPSQVVTFASMIMVLGPAPHLIAAPGAPHQYEYSAYRFSQTGNKHVTEPLISK